MWLQPLFFATMWPQLGHRFHFFDCARANTPAPAAECSFSGSCWYSSQLRPCVHAEQVHGQEWAGSNIDVRHSQQ
jgi:hypothetical protein